MSLSIDHLIQQPPRLHLHGSGNLVSWGLGRDALAFLNGRVETGSCTLEIGAGVSTLLFALKGARHTCITPRPDEVERIRAYCQEHQVSTDRVSFCVARSEEALPRLDSPALDLALIDGRHGFPAPFLDWYYLAPRLKCGGILVVDDTQLWTGRTLKEFLQAEPEWKLAANLSRTAAFEKLAEGSHLKEWNQQPFVARQSAQSAPETIAPPGPPPLAGGAAGVAEAQGRIAFQCNICGQACDAPPDQFGREISSCRHCRSSVRHRAIIRTLSVELFERSLTLSEFPERRDLTGLGLGDWPGYAVPLAGKFNYTNTRHTQEPRLDMTAIDPALVGTCDFLIAGDVFEHVAPPVARAFENARRLLKPGGVLILTVPYRKAGETTEHFPDLHRYEVDESGGQAVLRNVTRAGVAQTFRDLVFHGQSHCLELRVFSESSLMRNLRDADFKQINVQRAPDPAHGIFWSEDRSLPILARA